MNFGGAVRWDDLNGTISNSTFNNNKAQIDGGAVRWYNVNGAVSNSTFNNNKASYGGAISCYTIYNNVSSCLFINNTATVSGSVYYNDHSHNGYSNFTNNILLNNGPDEIFYRVFEGSNADYNWFGNNGSDYDQKPYENSNTWLFINGTANPNSIKISDISEITFKLYSYDGKEITEYDNSKLYPINLSLSSNQGTISKDTARLNEKITFQDDYPGIATVSAKAEDVQNKLLGLK